MSWQFLIAGILAGFAAFVHAFGGERTNIKHLLASAIPANEQVELRAVWHGFSLILLFATVGLLLMAFSPVMENPRTIAHVIALACVCGGIAFFVFALRAGKPLATPQWLLLFAVAVLSWWGAG
jgi:hypothetical protein